MNEERRDIVFWFLLKLCDSFRAGIIHHSKMRFD